MDKIELDMESMGDSIAGNHQSTRSPDSALGTMPLNTPNEDEEFQIKDNSALHFNEEIEPAEGEFEPFSDLNKNEDSDEAILAPPLVDPSVFESKNFSPKSPEEVQLRPEYLRSSFSFSRPIARKSEEREISSDISYGNPRPQFSETINSDLVNRSQANFERSSHASTSGAPTEVTNTSTSGAPTEVTDTSPSSMPIEVTNTPTKNGSKRKSKSPVIDRFQSNGNDKSEETKKIVEVEMLDKDSPHFHVNGKSSDIGAAGGKIGKENFHDNLLYGKKIIQPEEIDLTNNSLNEVGKSVSHSVIDLDSSEDQVITLDDSADTSNIVFDASNTLEEFSCDDFIEAPNGTAVNDETLIETSERLGPCDEVGKEPDCEDKKLSPDQEPANKITPGHNNTNKLSSHNDTVDDASFYYETVQEIPSDPTVNEETGNTDVDESSIVNGDNDETVQEIPSDPTVNEKTYNANVDESSIVIGANVETGVTHILSLKGEEAFVDRDSSDFKTLIDDEDKLPTSSNDSGNNSPSFLEYGGDSCANDCEESAICEISEEEEEDESEAVVNASMQFPLARGHDIRSAENKLPAEMESESSVELNNFNNFINMCKNGDPNSTKRIPDDLNLPSTVERLTNAYGSEVFLVGTAHFSKESQDDVAKTIRAVRPDIVVVELCKARTAVLQLDEETLLNESKNLDMAKMRMILRQHGAVQGVLYLLLLSVSSHITKELGMAPGGEFRAAFSEARKVAPWCLIQLGDRPIHITLGRALASLSVWQKAKLAWHILASKEPISKEEVEKCKQRDFIEEMLAEMTGQFPTISEVFVQERDIYLTKSLQNAAKPVGECTVPRVVVGVVGIGHIPGIMERWGKVTEEDIPRIMVIPPPKLTDRIVKTAFKVSFYGLLGFTVYKCLPQSAKSFVFSSIDSSVSNLRSLVGK